MNTSELRRGLTGSSDCRLLRTANLAQRSCSNEFGCSTKRKETVSFTQPRSQGEANLSFLMWI